MVWQDLMFATLDYPLSDDAFRATVEAEVRDQLGRLRDHPCVVVVCGSAEHEQQAAMFGISPSTGYAAELASFLRPLVEESGVDAVWVDGSPSGGDPVIRVRGSLFTGISTPSDAGSLPTSLSRSTFDFDRRSPSRTRRRSSPKAIGASEVVSTPPAAATS